MFASLPNLLTLLRIALIPILAVIFYLPFAMAAQVAAILFAVAALTDWLDGWLARRWQVTTPFGAFLDPVADKLIVATALVLIVDRNPVAIADFWLALAAAVIIGREITVSALREWMAELGARRKVAVGMLGKLKTTAQMVALILLLWREPIASLPTAIIGFWLLMLAVVLTLWSMILYLRAAWPLLMGRE
jgi:CDP-diacylglycerol--glycerol-3-phosphate 3-phosphatidyltransferase